MRTQTMCAGIDLARRDHHKVVVAQIDRFGNQQNSKAYKCVHDLPGLKSLCQFIQTQTASSSVRGIKINMEPTSGVWEVVCAFLNHQGASVFYTRPDVASALRKAQSRYAKTDRIDALTLANMPWSMPKRMIPYTPVPERIKVLRWLSAQRIRLVKDCTGWKNRFLAHIEQVWGPLLRHFTKEQPFSPFIRQLFRKFPDPRQLIGYSRKRFLSWCLKHSHANTDPQLFDTLWQGAQDCADLVEYLEQTQALNTPWQTFIFIMEQQLGQIQHFESEIKKVDKQITQARKEVPECDVVQEIPGVGNVVSVTLTSLLMPIQRISSAKKCSALSGLAGRKKQSSTKEVKGLPITKAGNNRLKRDVILSAETAMHRDAQLAQDAIELFRKGKHYNKVRVAIGRKITIRAYSLLKRLAKGEKDVHYQFRDLQGNDISKERSEQLARQLWDEYKNSLQTKGSSQNPKYARPSEDASVRDSGELPLLTLLAKARSVQQKNVNRRL